ncbi:hypothetical protein [Paenibacillus agricola]|uniref:Uncharacterized protein n=1 Tax=Paenibacillus agricola TaxID=2716264 RepID=A0ABX0J6V9_9BACL|nr:hypothetical protein [Paenibacillus agricola]NHN30904.1 hypothetical protein [Paenibacillus agricola]
MGNQRNDVRDLQDNVAETKYALLMETADQVDGETFIDIWEHLSGQSSGKAELFDHDADLLIFSTVHDCEAAQLLIEAYFMRPLETLLLLLLPDKADLRKEFTDYGFISHSSHPYVYADSAFLFSIQGDDPGAQPYQAFEQMDEHLLASFSKNKVSIFIADRQSDELMKRIARAYRCSITQLYPSVDI